MVEGAGIMPEVENQKKNDIFQPVGRMQQPSQPEILATNKMEHIIVITMQEQMVVMFVVI